MIPILFTVLDSDEYNIVLLIYEKYNRQMYSIAYNVLKNRSDAEDAVGDTILKISDHVSEFEGKSEKELVAMIYTYTKNTAISIYRKHKLESRHIAYDADVELECVVDDKANPEAVVISDDIEKRAYEIFRSLRESDQRILMLREMHGLSYSQIAELMDVSVDTVDSRIRRAKKKLSEKAGDIFH